ncbi:MAG: hypothetical protein Q7R87_00680 [Nanoarchaeota archaeon]|nr:hypothetical protein [Nanoarchaeota archaeon]
MKEIELLPVERGKRIWLPVRYGDTITRIAYPAFTGTHKDCFEAIGEDKELIPSQGLDLALIAFGAYNGKKPEWKDIRKNAFVKSYTRSPTINNLIPKGFIKGDKGLSGVLVQKDLSGNGLTSKLVVLDLNNFNQEASGLYVSADSNKIFVPLDKYKPGEHTADSFSKDGFAIATLTPEGAELFAKTAIDAKKVPYTWGINPSQITNPKQRVSLLVEGSGRLGLGGVDWGRGGRATSYGLAFAVSASKK